MKQSIIKIIYGDTQKQCLFVKIICGSRNLTKTLLCKEPAILTELSTKQGRCFTCYHLEHLDKITTTTQLSTLLEI